MKFNSHPPNCVFIKAFTITPRRRAWPAQPVSTQLCECVLYNQGRQRRARSRLRRGDFEKRNTKTCAVNRTARDCRSQQQPKRQLSLFCNLTWTSLTWAWVGATACPTAQNQLHLGQRIMQQVFVCITYHQYEWSRSMQEDFSCLWDDISFINVGIKMSRSRSQPFASQVKAELKHCTRLPLGQVKETFSVGWH